LARAFLLLLVGLEVQRAAVGAIAQTSGPETPANMQWQTVEEAKAKDRVE
jgi:hypothetical protein